jgi:hypothetical protein
MRGVFSGRLQTYPAIASVGAVLCDVTRDQCTAMLRQTNEEAVTMMGHIKVDPVGRVEVVRWTLQVVIVDNQESELF